MASPLSLTATYVSSYLSLQSHLQAVGFVGALTSANPLQLYATVNPFISGLFISLVISFFCFVFALPNRNYSQVDRLWSLLPVFYSWYFTLQPLAASYVKGGDAVAIDTRLMVMSILVSIWGLRLTYNFARKGGYSLSHQDYRWPILMEIIPNRFLFEIFNLTFIAIYQNVLIYLFSSAPSYICWLLRNTQMWTIYDCIAAGLFIFFLLGEIIADQQQWNYQTKKYELIDAKKELTGEYKIGFIRTGLFYFSRHPNFFCEQCIWWSYYLFSVTALLSQHGTTFATFSVQTLLASQNWSFIGALLLTLLFQGSTIFTEQISSKKYPMYKEYQRTTSMLVPWFPRKWKNE